MTNEILGYVLAMAAALAAAYERWRSQKLLEKSVNNSEKSELITVLKTSRDAWQERAEKEHQEFIKYREGVHADTNAVNTKMLALTNENAVLKAKTDLTPVLEYQEKQNQINTKVLQSFEKVIETLDGVQQQLRQLQPK